MNKEKGKATWDIGLTEIFIKECLEQIYQKQRQGTSFTKRGWDNIHSAFNEKTGKSYERKQMKNRLDSLRKDWKTWDSLCKETGVSWDPTTNTVVATNEWWEKKKQDNPQYEKFRYNGLRFANKLTMIFKGVMAFGEDMFAPSETQLQTQRGDQGNVCGGFMDLLEGSGDSEEELAGARVTDEFGNFNLTTNTTPSSSGSYGKRKKGEGSSRQTKQKIPASRQIADSISAIATASKDRATALNKMNKLSITEVTAEMLRLEEIRSDSDFRNRCLTLMMHKACREMFVALKGHQEYMISWLREMAYYPPPWLKPPPA